MCPSFAIHSVAFLHQLVSQWSVALIPKIHIQETPIISKTQGGKKHSNPGALVSITAHHLWTPPPPFYFLNLLMPSPYTDPFKRHSSPPKPLILIPRWINCSFCPWPQPFVAIRPDFLGGADLICQYQSYYTASFCSKHWAQSPFRPADGARKHTARDLSSSQISYYTAHQQWAPFSDAPQVRRRLSTQQWIVHPGNRNCPTAIELLDVIIPACRWIWA